MIFECLVAQEYVQSSTLGLEALLFLMIFFFYEDWKLSRLNICRWCKEINPMSVASFRIWVAVSVLRHVRHRHRRVCQSASSPAKRVIVKKNVEFRWMKSGDVVGNLPVVVRFCPSKHDPSPVSSSPRSICVSPLSAVCVRDHSGGAMIYFFNFILILLSFVSSYCISYVVCVRLLCWRLLRAYEL